MSCTDLKPPVWPLSNDPFARIECRPRCLATRPFEQAIRGCILAGVEIRWPRYGLANGALSVGSFRSSLTILGLRCHFHAYTHPIFNLATQVRATAYATPYIHLQKLRILPHPIQPPQTLSHASSDPSSFGRMYSIMCPHALLTSNLPFNNLYDKALNTQYRDLYLLPQCSIPLTLRSLIAVDVQFCAMRPFQQMAPGLSHRADT